MIRLEQLSIQAGSFITSDLTLQINAGEYAVLMGRTGCGKTTLLETICGLKPARAGRIVLNNQDVTRLSPAQRGVGYVPQDLALFPTHTVYQHLAFALELRRWTNTQIEQRVQELTKLLRLDGLLHRRPLGLSGGESQRVALGRALAFMPSVLLLDEPLSALDEETRVQMYDLLRSVQRQTGVTTLHVTHSPAEAKALADRIFRFENGCLRETHLGEFPNLRLSTGTDSNR